jgi:hypothetical protein
MMDDDYQGDTRPMVAVMLAGLVLFASIVGLALIAAY